MFIESTWHRVEEIDTASLPLKDGLCGCSCWSYLLLLDYALPGFGGSRETAAPAEGRALPRDSEGKGVPSTRKLKQPLL